MNQSYLEKLPIRQFDFITPIVRRQQSLQNAIAFYDQYQSDRQIASSRYHGVGI